MSIFWKQYNLLKINKINKLVNNKLVLWLLSTLRTQQTKSCIFN